MSWINKEDLATLKGDLAASQKKVVDLTQELANKTTAAHCMLAELEKQVAVLEAEKRGLQETLDYTKALLDNKIEETTPDEDEQRTFKHGQDEGSKRSSPLPRGWVPRAQRRRNYESQHSRGVTSTQKSVEVNTAALISTPRGAVETKK